MHARRSSTYYMLSLLAAAMTLPAAAQTANSDTGEVEEIFVSGKRRAYQGNFDALENPAANQVIDLGLLRDVGALNLNDALDLSASVARQNNFGGLWNSFSIRGFSGDINLPSGFLVNGFNAGRGFGGPRDIVGVESVEVLKGPRAALFGRGEPGGTVNIVTKRPEFESGGDVRLTVGSWQQLRLEGDVQSTLSDGAVGVRLVGFYEDAESFRDTVDTNRIGFYPSVTWAISPDTSATYELEYTSQEIPFDRGVVFSDEFGFSPRETFAGEPGDGPIETDVLGHQIEVQHNLSDNWSLLAGFGHRDTDFEGNASEPNFGGRQTYFRDGRTLSRFFRFRDFESDYTVLRAELAGAFTTGNVSHRLLFGADYDRFDNSLFILRFRPPGIGDQTVDELDPATYLLLDVFNPVYGQYPLPVPGPNTDRNEELTGSGVYLQDQMDITEAFQLRVGLRFDDFEQDLTNLRADPATTVTSSDSRVSPQVGAVYAVNDGVSLYASYGEGFRQQTGSDFEGNQFAPNLTESAELGFKADLGTLWDGLASGSLTVALFQVDQSNILVNDDRPEAVAAGFFSFTAGEARSRGVEIDANLSTETGLDVWFSYAYTNAEFTNSNPDADFGAQIDVGDQLINSPEHQASLQVSKRFDWRGKPTQFGGGVLYTGERVGWTGIDFFLPSYTTARLFGQIEPTDALTIRLDINNLFDEEFYTNSFADVWVEPGAPRRFRLSAAYAF